jgi:hypothetical protein
MTGTGSFYHSLKSKVGLAAAKEAALRILKAAAKAAALQINLNVEGCAIVVL